MQLQQHLLHQVSMEKAKEKKIFRTIRRIKNIFLGIVIVFLVIVLLMTLYSRTTGNTPSLFGYSMLRVSTGSMEPELEVHDVILVQQVDGATVKEKEIITYNGTSGEMAGRLVTHRVVKAPYQVDGETYLVTRGDANTSDDPVIKASQVEGRFVTKVTFMKVMFDFFATPWGLLALIGLIILAFLNEIIIFIKALFGDEGKPERSVDEIIEQYQREQYEKEFAEQTEEAEAPEEPETTNDDTSESEE